jgi:3-isopropylmalate/(R)-2-methylmalate dehydratase large subunit
VFDGRSGYSHLGTEENTLMGMTMAEKVLARASGQDAVSPGEYVTAVVDRMMAHEAFAACIGILQSAGASRLHDPDRLVVVTDHWFPAPSAQFARVHAVCRHYAEKFGVRNYLGPAGICHQVLPEQGFIRPGDLVLGTDSHSTTYGALGAAGAGIGLTEMAWVLATGSLWMRVPPTIRFRLMGRPGPALMSKDVILHIAGRFTTEVAQYASVEFAGPVADSMSIASRMTMSNMGVEIGAKFAFFPADAKTVEYLRGRLDGEPPTFGPDPDAHYAADYEIDVSGLDPQVACPDDPGNVRPITAVVGTNVDQFFLGSCTNARLEDLEVAAQILRDRCVAPSSRLVVTPASRQVYLDALRAGHIEALAEAGAIVTASACGACPGSHMGLLGPGEVCLSTTNRNFKGRMGSPEAQVYLASPATVAASAIAGRITDPREMWTGTTLSQG